MNGTICGKIGKGRFWILRNLNQFCQQFFTPKHCQGSKDARGRTLQHQGAQWHLRFLLVGDLSPSSAWRPSSSFTLPLPTASDLFLSFTAEAAFQIQEGFNFFSQFQRQIIDVGLDRAPKEEEVVNLIMADNILTLEKPSASSSLNPPSRIICHVCQKQFSQYTCPRCNSRYCSLQCYKSHSTRCTESFMQENVVQELQQMQPDDKTKDKMLEILKRFHSEEVDSMDDDAFADSTLSEETIEKILSGGGVDFDDLSPEVKKRFQRAIASGELSRMIKPWDPWWLRPSARKITLTKDGTRLVQPLFGQEVLDGIGDDEFCHIPYGPETPLAPVNKLSSREPSPLLTVHLVDILYSYCFTLRLYNGDWRSDAIGSAMVVLSVSLVLGQVKQPETVLEVLSHCLEQICSPAYRHMGGLQLGLGLVDDVLALMSLGGPALVCALCDLQRIIQAGEEELKSKKPRKFRGDEIRSTLKQAERKIYFIMCWVHEQVDEAWSSLAAIVRAEKELVAELQRSNRAEILNGKAKTESNCLIEEIK